MTCTSGEPTAEQCGLSATFSDLHPDVIETHILTRLDGASLASAAASCSQLHALSSSGDHLWYRACNATWPSTRSPNVLIVMNTFPHGPRSFFSDAFTTSTNFSDDIPRNPEYETTQLISAVDLFHGQDLILSNVALIDTETSWFQNSPFRIDLLGHKLTVRTNLEYRDDTCLDFIGALRVSWIIVDAATKRAVNVASRRPVSVRRHWFTGEVEARFATVVSGGERTAAEAAAVCVVVTWGVTAEGREMHVRDLSLVVEDLDGKHLNGKDSLVVLKRALKGKRVKTKVEDEIDRYEEFTKRKEERKEMKVRAEGRLDMLSLGLAAVWLAGLFGLLLFLWKSSLSLVF